MTQYNHYAIQRSEKPHWWDALPTATLNKFKEQIDKTIADYAPHPDQPCTVILTRRKQDLICIAALNEPGLELAYGMAITVAEKVGKVVEVLAITPGNYDKWWVKS